MKLRKITLIFSVILILTCFFAACDEAPDVTDEPKIELSLADFVYETEIDTDHVITEDELAAMNKVWLAEFGKKLADTPEEAMKREENGDFYFGRYGKTFVFYRKSFDMEMKFGWGKYDFVLPWGEFYFLSGEKVYTRADIAATDIFTDEHIDAFYNCYKNTYLSYKPEIVLADGDYVLTGEDLDAINLAYARKQGAKDTYKIYPTLQIAMMRVKDKAYYFGKYGDTVIIWSVQHYNEKKSFTLCGYEFAFYRGGVVFFDPNGVYRPEDEGFENIMTEAEAKAFYEHYVNYYLPLITNPYTYPELSVSIEIPTEDEMRAINEAYGTWKYEQIYNEYYQRYIEAKNTPADADKYAVRAVENKIGADPHRFFNENNFKTYQYWGRSGEKIFLATQNSYQVMTVIEIAGYKFVLDGSGCDLLVCESGKITPLAEAYEKGIVTKSEVAFAHERHLTYSASFLSGKEENPPPAKLKIGESYKAGAVKLTDDEVREIVWEYIAGTSNLESELEATYSVRCYGKFGNAYAVMIDGPWGYTQAIRSEVIAGYTFTFSDGQRMHIYKEGDFYTLNKAYALGIISEEDLVSIAWGKTLPYTYETATAPVQMNEEIASYALRSYANDNAVHNKGGVYSMRCYAKVKYGYAVFIDCSDKVYPKTRTVETVAGYEFIYPTEQTMLICYNWGNFATFADALEHEWLTESELKAIWESYRAAYPELYR